MNNLLKLSLQSSWSRRGSLSLLLLCISTSMALLLALDLIRQSAKESFAQSVSGTDLIVGGPGSALGLLLYSVFRLGEPARELPTAAVQSLEKDPRVAWTVPLALGDSFKGFPVVGTTAKYFDVFRYGNQQPLVLAQGRAFTDFRKGESPNVIFDAVLGAEVARTLKLALGDTVVLSHGTGFGAGSLALSHADKPFTVVGILQPTGTPVDRSVHVGLAAIEAIHLDWQGGAPVPGFKVPPALVAKFDLQPKAVTAVLVGLNNRSQVFAVRRALESQSQFPLTVALPGVALSELWDLLSNVENLLWLVSALVGLVSLLGLMGVMLMALQQRGPELQVLRSVGLGRIKVWALLVLEAAWVMALGALLAYSGVAALMQATGKWAQAHWGLVWVPMLELTQAHGMVLAYVALGVTLAMVPAWWAYRQQSNRSLAKQA